MLVKALSKQAARHSQGFFSISQHSQLLLEAYFGFVPMLCVTPPSFQSAHTVDARLS